MRRLASTPLRPATSLALLLLAGCGTAGGPPAVSLMPGGCYAVAASDLAALRQCIETHGYRYEPVGEDCVSGQSERPDVPTDQCCVPNAEFGCSPAAGSDEPLTVLVASTCTLAGLPYSPAKDPRRWWFLHEAVHSILGFDTGDVDDTHALPIWQDCAWALGTGD
jgi:hypothetical protein